MMVNAVLNATMRYMIDKSGTYGMMSGSFGHNIRHIFGRREDFSFEEFDLLAS
jgi:hypothetical protein